MEADTPRPVLDFCGDMDVYNRVIEHKYVYPDGIFEDMTVDDFLEEAVFRKELGSGSYSITSLYEWNGRHYVVRFVNDFMDNQTLINEMLIYKTLHQEAYEYCLQLLYADVSCGHFSNSYFVFSYKEGMTLQEYVDGSDTISVEFACHLALHLEKAIRGIHALGIFHRDIKPANIFLCKDTWIPYLFDFSDALIFPDEIQSPQSEYVGSPKYSHPRMLEQRYSFQPEVFRPEYDMYAVGIILRDDIFPLVRRQVDKQTVLTLVHYFLDSSQWDLVQN